MNRWRTSRTTHGTQFDDASTNPHRSAGNRSGTSLTMITQHSITVGMRNGVKPPVRSNGDRSDWSIAMLPFEMWIATARSSRSASAYSG